VANANANAKVLAFTLAYHCWQKSSQTLTETHPPRSSSAYGWHYSARRTRWLSERRSSSGYDISEDKQTDVHEPQVYYIRKAIHMKLVKKMW